MLSRLTRAQLIAFVLVSVITLTTVAVFYVRLPQLLGFGRYEVVVALPEGGGLYPRSQVTYRGVGVGSVSELRLAGDGVEAVLAIDAGVAVPADLDVQVRSVSAVGEQYINLVPRRDGAALRPGDTVDVARAVLPVSTDRLLTGVQGLLDSVPRDSLTTTVDELYEATNGSGDDLALLLDSAFTLQDEADANLGPLVELIADLVPVLGTQRDIAPELGSSVRDLADLAEQLASSDPDLRGVIIGGGPLAREVSATFGDLGPTLPVLLADLATTGQVLRTYLPGIEQTVIVLPAVVEGLQAGTPRERLDDPYPLAGLNFKASVNDPPVCVEGYEFAQAQRDPSDLREAPLPQNSFCDVDPDDPRVVRGARNLPCPDDPQRRAPTAAGCGLRFDRVQVPGAAPAAERLVGYDPETGRVLAPDGEFFRMADLARAGFDPRTWQDLLRATVLP